MLSIALILAVLRGAPEDAAVHPVPSPTPDQGAWLRGWLPRLDAGLATLLDGLATTPAEDIVGELDARIDDPRFCEWLNSAMHHLAEHASELADHWPRYQDEITRVSTRLVREFPECSVDIVSAVAIARDCEWALLEAEREHRTLSKAFAFLLEHGGDSLAVLDDPALPPGWRERLRAGLRGAIAGACLSDIAERGARIDPDLAREIAAQWHTAMIDYAAVTISGMGLEHPGMPARLGFEAYVDVQVIDEMNEWRGAPTDPIVGVFAGASDDIDEITAAAMRAREADEWRGSPA